MINKDDKIYNALRQSEIEQIDYQRLKLLLAHSIDILNHYLNWNILYEILELSSKEKIFILDLISENEEE